MTTSALLAAATLAVAVMVWNGARAAAELRLRRLPSAGAAIDGGDLAGRRVAGHPGDGRSPLTIWAVGAAGAAVALLLLARGVSPGLILPAALAGAAFWWFAGRDDRAGRTEQARLARLLPEAADLLAACLDAGAHAPEALEVVGSVVGAPLDARFRRIAGGLRLGADPADAWATGPGEGDVLAPLARAFVRASRTGAPLAGTVGVVADEQRRRLRWSAESAARRAGVAAVGPLAACFLPAFVLIGVVPVVLSVAAELVAGLR